jgi:anti-sigma-K factor RskA
MEPPKKELSQARGTSPAIFRVQEKDSTGFLWLYVAAFVILVVLGGTIYAWYSTRQANAELEENLSAVNSDFDNLNTLLDSQRERAERLEQAIFLIGKPEVRMARLLGETPGQPYFGTILWDPEQDHCFMVGSLPPPPELKAYQLWFVNAATRASAGMIPVSSTGNIFMEVPVPETAVGAASVLITTEPEGGSQEPTRPYYAAGRFN